MSRGGWPLVRVDMKSLLKLISFLSFAFVVKAVIREDSEKRNNDTVRHSSFFETYHTYDEIQIYLVDVDANFKYVTLENLGLTYEGRNITAIKICYDGACGLKPALYIQCNIHAREWITCATCLYIINELTANRHENEPFLKAVDWYILPLLNADGYAYSWSNQRLWRKTRAPTKVPGCFGVDLNRNWDDHFRMTHHEPCSIEYEGPRPFSEPDTKAASDFILAHREIVYFQDLHAFAEYILYPYGYTSDSCRDSSELKDLALRGAAAMNRKFWVAPVSQLPYNVSGVSIDWAYNAAGIKYSFSIECGPNDKDVLSKSENVTTGWLVPPEEIVTHAEEVWLFHKFIAEEMKSVKITRTRWEIYTNGVILLQQSRLKVLAIVIIFQFI